MTKLHIDVNPHEVEFQAEALAAAIGRDKVFILDHGKDALVEIKDTTREEALEAIGDSDHGNMQTLDLIGYTADELQDNEPAMSNDPPRPIRLRIYQPNFTGIELGEVDLFFSYETLVAIRDTKHGWVVSKNVWSATTGHHMNKHIPVSKDDWWDHDEWESKVAEILRKHGLLV